MTATHTKRRRVSRTISGRQVTEWRSALHAYVDACCDGWPAMCEAVGSIRAGRGNSRATTYSDPTGEAAMVSDRYLTWLGQWAEVRNALMRAATNAAFHDPSARPLPQDVPAEAGDEVCAHCKLPGGRFMRVDGVAFHAKPDPCYYRRWRAERG